MKLEHFNFISLTNEEYKNIKIFKIKYGFCESPFGPCIMGVSDNKLCYAAFYDEGAHLSAAEQLKKEWPRALLEEDNEAILPFKQYVFENHEMNQKCNVLLKGTNFQIDVWKELTKLKAGVTTSYENIAKSLQKPKSIRAVASAIARNKIAYIIPCHRVIRKSGNVNKYKWGVSRKKDILNFESL